MQVWNVLHAARWNTGRKKIAKIRHLRTIHHRTTLSDLCNWGIYRQSEKNISSICPHNMVNVDPLTAEIGLPVWAPQQISTGFVCWLRYCTDVVQRTSNVARCLAVSWAGTLHCVSKKLDTLSLSVTLSNLNRCSNFCTAGKRMKFATKPIQHYPPHLRNVATLPWKIKTSHFMRTFSRYGRKCKQIAVWVHRSSADCQMKRPRTSFCP